MTRRAATIAAVALAVIALGVVTAASYEEARALLSHRGTRPRVTPADSGLAYETVPFAASDGTVLEGWWIVPRDGVRRRDLATVVLAHPEVDSLALATGVSGKARMLGWAAPLSRAGFIVLAFDFRSYGGSAGHLTTGGWPSAATSTRRSALRTRAASARPWRSWARAWVRRWRCWRGGRLAALGGRGGGAAGVVGGGVSTARCGGGVRGMGWRARSRRPR